ncbi:MAG: N-acetylglucosamine-6-phosphate deacetylase [Defluviitaleaceae bacterium]|nr:N-acetylglucosamine-6-phosphate deacetylase [Defluviitaleaceae bacterium]
MKTIIINANVITDGKILKNHAVHIENGQIILVTPDNLTGANAKIIDAQGDYLSAGLIDLHIHGGMNHDFMDATPEAIEGIATYHMKHGVTSMLATTAPAEDSETFAFLETFTKHANSDPRYLGVHLEGPYLNPAQCGAINPNHIHALSPSHYEALLNYDCVKRVTAAPELEGGLAFGTLLREKGILASMGHTEADYDMALQALEYGYNSVTHLYSCTVGLHRKNAYRHGGLIEAALLHDSITAEIIADNRHLPASLLKLIYKCKGKYGIILTSDAMRGAGLADGQITKAGSLARGQDVIIEDGVAKMLDRQAFAGSVASGDRLIRTMVHEAGVPLPEAIMMMTINPARLIGLSDSIGDVRENMAADLIVFDSDINIKKVMVKGTLQHEVENASKT